MKELANYKVMQYANAVIRVYDDMGTNAPEPISKAIIEWFEKTRFKRLPFLTHENTRVPK